jgi:hypothetical protein
MREPYVVEGHFAFISQSCDTSGNINVMWPSLSLSCQRNQHDINAGQGRLRSLFTFVQSQPRVESINVATSSANDTSISMSADG